MNNIICSKEAEISEIHTIVKRLDLQLGGREGMIAEFNQLKGAIKILYFIASVGGITSIVAILRTIF